MKEVAYGFGALAGEEVVSRATSLDPAPEVIHIDLLSPLHNCYVGEKSGSTELWRELRFRVPSLLFLHLLPTPATINQLLNAMRTNPVATGGWQGARRRGKRTVRSFVTFNWLTIPAKKSTECLATSSTPRASAGVERERNTGW